ELGPTDSLEVADVKRLAANLPLYIQYARAGLAFEEGQIDRSLEILEEVGRTRRGLPGPFLKIIADEYNTRVKAGDPAPTTAIAEAHDVHKSTASRWITQARRRGWVPASGYSSRP